MLDAHGLSIVAVHGLGGKRWDTWESKPKPGKPSKMWLNDFLPNTVPDARIMTYGYDARFWAWDQSCQTPYDHGKTLLARLSVYRRYTEVRKLYSYWQIQGKDKNYAHPNISTDRASPDNLHCA